MSEFSTNQKPASLVGTIVAERYQIEELLGAGAMGQVYRARHVHMHKQVALKVLHRETSENSEIVSRFEREAIAAGRINHPNVAGATDFGRLPDGAFYLVLEYISGQSLGALLDAEGALPLSRALGIASQIFSALAAAHRAEIVHRDLKPENVMLLAPEEIPGTARASTHDGHRDFIKVLDFGLAKLQKSDAADTQLTQAGAIYGTPQYMAPEQASGAEVDRRADLYAAGVVLYEMLAGKPPFQADQIMPLLILHMTEPPPPLPDFVPKSIRRIVSRLLEKEPNARYQTADEVLDALGDLGSFDSTASTEQMRANHGLDGPGAGSRALLRRAESVLQTTKKVLARPVEVRGRRVPLAVPLGAGAALLFGIWLVLPSGEREENPKKPEAIEPVARADAKNEEPQAPSAPPKSVDAELMKVIDAVKLGSDPALYALEHREDGDRSDIEWMALTQAYLMRRDIDKALASFGHALDENPGQATDMTILGALRYLADDEKLAEPILEFVAKRLPDVAADFLFDVWSKTSKKTKATETAKELLEANSVKEHQSEALTLALTLRDKTDCAQQVDLLPRIILRADERSLTRLREMKKDSACAKLAGKNLDEALTQAALRKAPRFPLLRRWRWKTGEGPAPGETQSEPKGEKKKKFILF